MVEHDVLNMTCVVEGVDQLKEQKESIGKAFSDVATFTDASLVVNGVSVPRVSDAKCTPEAPQDKKYPIIYVIVVVLIAVVIVLIGVVLAVHFLTKKSSVSKKATK